MTNTKQAILFLDVDGVLNGHDWHEGARSNVLRKGCIDQLSRIIQATDCCIVLSSAWRYIVTSKEMTLLGFSYMLRTHGCSGITAALIDTTAPDEHCPGCGYKHKRRRGKWECSFSASSGYRVCVKCATEATRGLQITAWLKDHKHKGNYVALDDEDYEIRSNGHPLVKTDGATGMVEKDATKVIRLLRRRKV